ncbi:ATP-binding protein [Dactylosporangium sp. CA-092794]|uniref:ATP-binding protein n=1 Tax=Dactylosporangium sp. CA-092794 TaxID=3239929 RepID=UPI003D8EB58D
MDTLAGSAGLVARDHELGMLQEALRRLLDGRGGAVWVEGEPGIGKSALVRALTGAAAQAGCLVRVGVGVDLAEVFPFRLMADCLGVRPDADDPALADIARLLRGEPDRDDRAAAPGERMLEVVDRLCAASPVVLVAEDLQWADEPSLALWSRLSRSVDQIPLLLVGSCRGVPHRPALTRLGMAVRDMAGTVLPLRPLGTGETIALARQWLGAEPGPRLARELARAGGNPLYLRELVDAWVRADSLAVTGGAAELVAGAEAVPASVIDVVGRRLGFLSEPTSRALRLAALLGTEFGIAEWATAAGSPVTELAAVVDEALASGVLVDGGRGLAFRHDLIRQAMLEQLPAALRAAIHQDLARRLAQAGHRAEEVARHLLVGDGLDDWALTWLAEVSDPTVSTAPHLFAELSERAVGRIAADDPRWASLASRLAQTQYQVGADGPAAQTSLRVLRTVRDPELAGLMWVLAVRALGRSTRYTESAEAAAKGLEDPRLPAHWQARLRAWAAQTRFELGDPDGGYRLAAVALAQARDCGDDLGAGYALKAMVWCSTGEEQLRCADEALAILGHDAESTDLRVLLLNASLGLLDELGAVERYDALLPQALLAAERLGTARSFWVPATASEVCYRRGDWDEALRFQTLIPDTIEALTFGTVGIRAEIAFRRGRYGPASGYLQAAGVLDGDPGGRMARELTRPLMLRAELDGDLARALAHGRDLLASPIKHVLGATGVVHSLIRIALALGDEAAAAQTLDIVRRYQFPEVDAQCCAALIERDADALMSAVDGYARHRWHCLEALAWEEAAAQFAADGAGQRAHAALTSAIQLYQDFGAEMDIQRARSRLRLLGVRAGARVARRRAKQGWDALTPAEERVARLAGQGLSNPDIAAALFVSRATVQTHVSNVLAKLGVRSRLELVRRFAATPEPDGDLTHQPPP